MTIQEEALAVLVKTAVRLFNAKAETLSGETKFADLKCKSVDLVKFSTALEDEFEIEVPYMQMRRCVTFADACNFVAKEIEG